MSGGPTSGGLGDGTGGRESPSGAQGRSPGRGSGRRSSPEAEALFEKSVLIFSKK